MRVTAHLHLGVYNVSQTGTPIHTFVYRTDASLTFDLSASSCCPQANAVVELVADEQPDPQLTMEVTLRHAVDCAFWVFVPSSEGPE